jgi:hypothetical protein
MIHIHLQAGDEASLPPGFVEAFDALLRSLEGGDVSGYRLGTGCDPFSCTGHTDNPCFQYRTCPTLTSPCAAKLCMPYTCRVELFRRLG